MSHRIYLFDTFRLAVDGRALEIRSEKVKLLLAYLILHPNTPIDRDRLAEALWPKSKNARRNLREYLYRARNTLAEFWPNLEVIESEGNFIHFAPPAAGWIDVHAFEQRIEEARAAPTAARKVARLQEACDLYRGELLSTLYEDWISAERNRLHELYLHALARLSEAHQATGNLTDAIATAQQLLLEDPLQERTHRRLMELYVANGDRARAIQQYQTCCQKLEEELWAQPMPETQELYAAIVQGTYRPDPAPDPAPPAPMFTPFVTDALLEKRTQTPFVGRTGELAQLSRHFEESQSGPSLALVITGESGIGKTRLANEWLARLPEHVTVLKGRGYEFEQAIPYRPLLDALQHALHRVTWELLPAEAAHTWLAPLAQLLPDLYFYLPDVAAGDSPEGDTSHYVLEGLAQLILSFARRQPLILFLDDLHWADLPTWNVLRLILSRAGALPLFVVATFSLSEATVEQMRRLVRLEKRTPLLQTLKLEESDPDDFVQLVSHMLDRPAETIGPFAHRLYDIAKGNIFFATETLRTLLDDLNAAEARTAAFRPADLEQIRLPNAVKVLIENRLARLEAASNLSLCQAAAVGREFTFDLVLAATGREEDELLDYFDDWLARGLIVEIDSLNGRYDFTHQQVREAAYGRLSNPRRRRTHYRIATALEELEPNNIERIAYHYQRSHRPARAVPGLLTAGRRALNLRSYHDARAIGRMLLDILRRAPRAVNQSDQLEVNLQLALAYSFTGNTEEALAMLRKAARIADTEAHTVQSGEVALRIAQIHWIQGDVVEARAQATQARRLLEAAGANQEAGQLAAVLRLLGRIAVAQGHFEKAVDALKRALALNANPLHTANALGYLATAHAHEGQKEAALTALTEAQAMAQRLESPALLAVTRVQAAVAYGELGLWAEAKAAGEQGLRECEAQHIPVYSFVARMVLGRAAHYLGDGQSAYVRLRAAIQWAQESGYLLFRHWAHVYLAEVALACGDGETVRAQCDLTLVLARRTGNVWAETRAQQLLAQSREA